MLRRISLPLVLCFLLSNCSLHHPMSEMAIGQSDLNKTKFGLGFTGSITGINGKPIIRRDTKDCLNIDCRARGPIPSPAMIGLFFRNKNYSFSLGMPSLGFDVTNKIGEQTFMTLSASAFAGGQVNIMRYKRHSGFVQTNYGISYRVFNYPLERGSGPDAFHYESIFHILETKYIHAFGFRASHLSHTSLKGKKPQPLHLFLSSFVGFVPVTRQPVVSFSISIGG